METKKNLSVVSCFTSQECKELIMFINLLRALELSGVTLTNRFFILGVFIEFITFQPPQRSLYGVFIGVSSVLETFIALVMILCLLHTIRPHRVSAGSRWTVVKVSQE